MTLMMKKGILSITFEERKKFSSGELRDRTEEIMSEYLAKFENLPNHRK